MISGFDFGTANCSMGTMNHLGEVGLLPINGNSCFMPSALYSLHRDLVSEFVAITMKCSERNNYMNERDKQLERARYIRLSEDIDQGEDAVFVGDRAISEYLAYPGEGYFVKSVKSFLGCSGLEQKAIQFFEDLVTSIMLSVKERSEEILDKEITHTVIGKPINFQGVYPEKSNKMALEILTKSAKRSGFEHVEFLYEPLAAGFDFEQSLLRDEIAMIVDVGGGTTDCTILEMGPSYRNARDRSKNILASTGDRIGGNDYDIELAYRSFMPLFGLNSMLQRGSEMPNQIFRNAVRTNHIGSQILFNSQETEFLITQYLSEVKDPTLLRRFIKLRNNKMNHKLVQSAEKAKIQLSETSSHCANLDYIEKSLNQSVSMVDFERAAKNPLRKMTSLMDEAVRQAGRNPSLIYVTGGASKSPFIKNEIENKFHGTKVLEGDHFGSVAKGLTVWADKIYA